MEAQTPEDGPNTWENIGNVPFFLGNRIAGFRGKGDGNDQQRLFYR